MSIGQHVVQPIWLRSTEGVGLVHDEAMEREGSQRVAALMNGAVLHVVEKGEQSRTGLRSIR
jgi:hypothetical protein